MSAETEADEVKDRAAATAAVEIGTGSTITTTDNDEKIANIEEFAKANSATYTSSPGPKSINTRRGLKPMTHIAKRSRSVTFADLADVNGDVGPHDHCDEDSYRFQQEEAAQSRLLGAAAIWLAGHKW